MFHTQTTFKYYVNLRERNSGREIWIDIDAIAAFLEKWRDGEFYSTEIYLRDVDPYLVEVKESGKEILKRMKKID